MRASSTVSRSIRHPMGRNRLGNAVHGELACGERNVVQATMLRSSTGPSATAASFVRRPLRTALYSSMWLTPAARAIWRNVGARLLIRARFDEYRMVRSCLMISALSGGRKSAWPGGAPRAWHCGGSAGLGVPAGPGPRRAGSGGSTVRPDSDCKDRSMKPGRRGYTWDMLLRESVLVADLSGRGDKPALPFTYQYHTSSRERLG